MSTTKGKVVECRAAVAWEKGKPLVIEKIQVSPPKAKEVRIKLSYTGLCHTDVSALRGNIPTEVRFPVVVGHEGSGVVESVGEGVTKVKEGDHVATFPMPSCGECSLCKSDMTNACMKYWRKLEEYGFMADGTTRFSCRGHKIHSYLGSSTFSEYTVMEQSQVSKINKDAPMEKVCLLSCGVSTGYGAAVNTAKVKPGSTCGVFGLGTVGLAVVMGCKQQGAGKIIGVDINSEKGEIAKKFGLTDFFNPKEHNKPIWEVLIENSQGGCDYTFECAGVTQLMEAAFNSCRVGFSQFVVIGVPAVGQTFSTDPFQYIFGRQIIGSWVGGYTSKDLSQLVEAYLKKKIMLDEFITSTSPLEGLNQAIENMGKGSGIKHVASF